jgi:hypothetical protein
MLQPDPNERFRQRRHQSRRRIARRRLTALAVLVIAFGAVTLGFRYLGETENGAAHSTPKAAPVEKAPNVEARTLPAEIRGVHVTMALLSLPGKLNEYLAMRNDGMTTLEVDVKDENGEVGYPSAYAPLARKIGSARTYYRPRQVADKVHEAGLYLIGRVVMFEDPYLASKRPDMAIQRRGGGVWTNSAGLGWANPYDKRVWDYDVDIAESAARAGFDEIMFDYVRFPSDGRVEDAVFPGRVNERKGETIARFLAYAQERLKPLGVRVSAAVFGLAATRDLGIGQRPKLMAPHLDAIYPMVYPSHFGSGEYNIASPDNAPGATVTMALRQFRRALTGSQTRLVPWLQDFSLGRTYTLGDVESQIDAARKVRSSGYLLWNANGVYTENALGY